MAFKTKTLPAGFRHLFSKRKIRELEKEMGIKFFDISFGHLINSQRISAEAAQILLHPVSLPGHKAVEGWTFSLHQSGFREELLAVKLEPEVKNRVVQEIKRYMDKATKFINTDFIQRPQLWIYCFINQDTIKVKSRELR